MKKNLPLIILSAGFIFLTDSANSQQRDRFAYSITDLQQGTANWTQLRKLNLATGEYSQVLLNGTDIKTTAYNAATKKQFEKPVTDSRYGELANAAFGTGVASAAYDKKNNRLYYSPMFIDQLRYIDLRSMKTYYVSDEAFTGKPVKSADQGNIVTRMVIASDGNGYAMTNDGTQLIRFTTGKRTKITDMGPVVDDPANGSVSIHNSCSSFGGDMVADDEGNLYVFSARNHVFKINIESKVATHIGVVTGLQAGFSINGAAVTNDNKIIVSTAVATATSYFSVDYKTLAASPYVISGTILSSADLANSNLLVTAAKNENPVTSVMTQPVDERSADSKVNIFPNPVTNNQFVVQLRKLDPGKYTIFVTDAMGKQVHQQVASVKGISQAETVQLDPSAARGMYLIKVTDHNSRMVYSTKVVVQ